MNNKLFSLFSILFSTTLLSTTLQAEDRQARASVTIRNAAGNRSKPEEKPEPGNRPQPSEDRVRQPAREIVDQNERPTSIPVNREENNERTPNKRVPVQIPPSNTLHTRPSLKNSRVETGNRSIESRVPVTKRPLPCRPLPLTIKLDRRCVPSNAIILHPFAIKPKGSVIELVDGSVWHIKRKRDRHLVRHWSMRDDIIVESNQLLGWKTYKLVNYTRGDFVEAELSLSECNDGSASHWITRIDKSRGIMELEDGTLWSITASSYEDWHENDAVILGLSGNGSGLSLYMIINARTMRHIAVTTLR